MGVGGGNADGADVADARRQKLYTSEVGNRDADDVDTTQITVDLNLLTIVYIKLHNSFIGRGLGST